METIVAATIISAIGYWIYKNGKRIGSREGFHAGKRSRRPRRNRPRRTR
jgi:hypothetical protein